MNKNCSFRQKLRNLAARKQRESSSGKRPSDTRDNNTRCVSNASHQPFAYYWTIRGFHELVACHPTGCFMYSERFWSPSTREPLENPSSPAEENTSYLWRLKIYPKGVDDKSKDHVAIYLEAFQSPYEKKKNIITRIKTFRFAFYRLDANPNTTALQPSLIICRHLLETTFEFGTHNRDYGFAKMITLKDLCLGDDNSKQLDLMVRLEIYNDAYTGESSEEDDSANCSLLPFERFFNDEQFADVELVFDCGSRIKAHRVVLAARSAYFEKLLGGDWLEGQMKQIHIKDVSYEAFQCVLYHLYTSKLQDKLSIDVLKDVYLQADMLCLEQFGKAVVDRLISMINADLWDQILMFGWEVGDHQVKTGALEYVATHWYEVKESENMKRILEMRNIDLIEEIMSFRFFGVQK